jgi:hypothetical protein
MRTDAHNGKLEGWNGVHQWHFPFFVDGGSACCLCFFIYVCFGVAHLLPFGVADLLICWCG